MQLSNDKQLETPCVGICSTIYGDDICRGCFRSLTEITYWNAYTKAQKSVVLSRLNTHITAIVASKLEITSTQVLQQKCQQHHIKIREHFSPYTWAHALLREGMHHIHDIQKYGIKILAPFTHLSLAQLISLIDDEIHQKSPALSD